MKVLAVMAVITLCLMHASHSFGSQARLPKPIRCKTKPYGTAIKTQLEIMKRLLTQKHKKELIDSNLALPANPHLKMPCNILKVTELQYADKPIQICKRFHFGIQIFLVTAMRFSKLATTNSPEELLQKERDVHENLQLHLNLLNTELLECFTQIRFYNQTREYRKLIKTTKKRALKCSKSCFLIRDISHQKSYNNIVYYRNLIKFLNIGHQTFKKIDREWKKKNHCKYI